MRVLTITLAGLLLVPAVSQKAQTPDSAFRSSFEQALAAYHASRFADAASLLEKLQKQAPADFEIRELLGLSYAAESQNAKALEQLRKAAELSPHSVPARNNLATSLVLAHMVRDAESEWRAALTMDPKDYTANRNLARLYLQQGYPSQAIPLLETARQSRPDSFDSGYDLALAYEMVGDFATAGELANGLLREKESGELHVLLGHIDEKQSRYVDAVNEFSQAAHLDPSEDNLFEWASELMRHRAYEPAITIFKEGTRRFPTSPRLWVGQGMALYSRGDYRLSIEALLKATDLNAEDSRAYLFLSKAYLSSPSQADEVIERFRRYAALKPNDALAQYDYAVSLWKGKRVDTPEIDYPAVQSLLLRSLALDDANAEVHLQLGILYNDQHEYDKAKGEFERAASLDPSLADAHFRLGRAYLRAGDKVNSAVELDKFKQLQAQHQAALDKERAEVQQFVIATQNVVASEPPSQGTP